MIRVVVAIHHQVVAHVIDLKTTNQLDFPVLYFLKPFISFLTPVSPLAFLSKMLLIYNTHEIRQIALRF